MCQLPVDGASLRQQCGRSLVGTQFIDQPECVIGIGLAHVERHDLRQFGHVNQGRIVWERIAPR